jgi:solute carrier family 25 phosphate transporter 23/24/25/41
MSDKSKSQYVMEGKDSTIGFFIGGAIAGAVSRTVAAPFERLKILYQVEDLSKRTVSGQKYNGIVSSLRRIYIEEGIRGFFKGNGTNIVSIHQYTCHSLLCLTFVIYMICRCVLFHILQYNS